MAIECYQLAFRNSRWYEAINKAAGSAFKAYKIEMGRRSSYLSQEAFALNVLERDEKAYTKASEALKLNPNNTFAKDQLTDAENEMFWAQCFPMIVKKVSGSRSSSRFLS